MDVADVLDALIPDTSSAMRRRQGVVTAVTGATVSVRIAGATAAIAGVRRLVTYAPAVGDTVWLVMADNGDAFVWGRLATAADLWHEVGTAGEPAFTNGWVNFDAVQPGAAFMKDAMGFVHVRGVVRSGTYQADMFTLPVGYRVAKGPITCLVLSNAAMGAVQVVENTGRVRLVIGSTTYACLYGVSFFATA